MTKDTYSLFVNTTDSFEDCWLPFFTLFKKYWPDFSGIIYLNTETKNFSFEGLHIVCLHNQQKIWSECVKTALEKIDSEYVLYLQEDYFFKDFVKTDLLNQYFELMKKEHIDCLHLTDQHCQPVYLKPSANGIQEISQKAKDRISCQAAFWKKEVLLSYLQQKETGWQFETYGTMRAHYLNHRFFTIDRNTIKLNSFEIIPYIFTAIYKGKWIKEVEPLLKKNKIDVDLSKRGFYSPAKISFSKRLIAKIKRQPKYFLTQWDIIKIRLKQK